MKQINKSFDKTRFKKKEVFMPSSGQEYRSRNLNLDLDLDVRLKKLNAVTCRLSAHTIVNVKKESSSRSKLGLV